jgi:hypothetical protein
MLGMSIGIRSSRRIAESWCERSRSECSGPGGCIQFWKLGVVSHNLCNRELKSAFTFTFVLFFYLFPFPFLHTGSLLLNHDDSIINFRFYRKKLCLGIKSPMFWVFGYAQVKFLD